MVFDETIGGRPVEEKQVLSWANEAEAGYNIQELKARGRGRPGRGNGPSEVVALRLTREELVRIDARAKRDGTTRSDVIRAALNAWVSVNH
jgi:hypothetical protein